jgi:hypothetical protein
MSDVNTSEDVVSTENQVEAVVDTERLGDHIALTWMLGATPPLLLDHLAQYVSPFGIIPIGAFVVVVIVGSFGLASHLWTHTNAIEVLDGDSE